MPVNFGNIQAFLTSAFSVAIMVVAIAVIAKVFKGNMKAIATTVACVMLVAVIFSIGATNGGPALGTTVWTFLNGGKA